MADNVTIKGLGAKAKRRVEFSTTAIEGSAWSTFKKAWSGVKISRIFIVAIICALFCAPAVVWVMMFLQYFTKAIGTSFNYGLFDGLGYAGAGALTSGMNTAEILGAVRYYEYAVLQYAVLIPCIALGAIGIGGLVTLARKSMFEAADKPIRIFFEGVKQSWLPAIIGGTLVSACIFLVVFCAHVFTAYGLGLGGMIATMILSIILLVFASIYAFYLLTLNANYKMPLGSLLKDAFILTFKRFVSNIITALMVSLIIGLAFMLTVGLGSSGFDMVAWSFLFMFGFYAICAIFVSSNQKTFETVMNDGIEEREAKARTQDAYAAIRAAKAAGERPVKKSQAPQSKYVNPKKKKKSESAKDELAKEKIDPFKIEPIRAKGGYTAEELAKIEEDKQKILAEENKVTIEDLSAYTDDDE